MANLSQLTFPFRTATQSEKLLANNGSSQTKSSFLASPSSFSHSVEEKEYANPIYQILSRVVSFPTADQKFWWTQTASILGRMMTRAEYDVHEGYFYLLFYHAFIVPALGPRPPRLGDNSPPAWKSFMTDDFTPVEFSWNFTAAQSVVRFGLEPIGPYAGCASDPFNQIETVELLRRIAPTAPDLDLCWFNHFANEFFVFSGNADGAQKRLPSNEHSSQAFVAFDLDQGRVSAKGYVLPVVKAAETGIPAVDLVSQALRKLDTPELSVSPAWMMVEDYIRSQPIKSQPKAEMVGIDCIDPQSSRIKVYIRSPHTALKIVKDIFTLGGRLKAEHTALATGFLDNLWRLVLNIPADMSDEEELRPRDADHTDHRTSGTIFNFEIKPGVATPEPKLYIPVRHHARSDMDIANGLVTFFRRQGWSTYAQSYVNNLNEIFPDHPLSETTGTQTYISFAYKKVGGIYLSVYYNARIYSSALQ